VRRVDLEGLGGERRHAGNTSTAELDRALVRPVLRGRWRDTPATALLQEYAGTAHLAAASIRSQTGNTRWNSSLRLEIPSFW
jgi:hypothetical protein